MTDLSGSALHSPTFLPLYIVLQQVEITCSDDALGSRESRSSEAVELDDFLVNGVDAWDSDIIREESERAFITG